MPQLKTHTRSFAGGEITPELYGRLDLAKFQTGLALALNFWTLPHGPSQNRPGFGHVLEAGDSTRAVRVVAFQFNTEQTFAIEFGHLYIRWHTLGGTLLETGLAITGITQANPGVLTYTGADPANGDWMFLAGIVGMTELNGRYVKVANVNAGANTFELTDLWDANISTLTFGAYVSGGTASRVYEIAAPYAEADLFDLHFTQSADVLTIVHPTYDVRELRRLGAASWQLSVVEFAPVIDPPGGIAVAVGAGTGTDIYQYKVTGLAADGLEESIASKPATSTSTAITAVTQANPGVVTSTAHGRAVDDPVYIEGVVGMTELNFGELLVNTVPTADTLTLKTLDGVALDTTLFGAYVSGGTLYFAGIENDLTAVGANNVISWTADDAHVRYNVYKELNGLYGFIGQAANNKFIDDNITPDTSQTPPIEADPFDGTDNFPGAVGYAEGRRAFAGTNNKPQNYFFTRSGTESNLSYSIPSRDDDTIQGRMLAREVNRIRHIVPLDVPILLTSGGPWKIAPQNSDVLTPSSAVPKPVLGEGASNVQPAITASSLLYVAESESRVLEMKWNWESSDYRVSDASIMAPHLFDGFSLVDMAYAKAPYRMAWAVRDDGVLLGLTYLPEHEVLGWHKHTTVDGTFESVCSVKEGREYPVYAVIRRTVDGRVVRYIERLHSRFFNYAADAFFVDSGLTYDGAAATVISGLWHLEGQTVAILADGAEVAQQVVTNGAITLEVEASVVHIGLPITADMQGLPLAMEALSAFGQGAKRNLSEVWLRVKDSGGIKAGPTFDKLRELPARSNEPYDSPPDLKNGIVRITLDNQWDENGQICIRQDQPLPVTISAMTLAVATGG